MATFVSASCGVEFPRKVDADTSGVAVLAELGTDVDSAVSRHLRITGVEDVVGKDGYTEALVLEELTT